jgi:hypothetical protein
MGQFLSTFALIYNLFTIACSRYAKWYFIYFHTLKSFKDGGFKDVTIFIFLLVNYYSNL